LLVSYSWGQFRGARQESIGILKQLGDQNPTVERTAVMGLAIVHTALDNRHVIQKCKELVKRGAFEFAIKWVPVDYWCETSLDAMKDVIESKVRDGISENETWGMVVEKRRWQKYHTIEIIEYLAAGIGRKVDLNNPDKIVRIDIAGKRTAISLLKPDEIFSLGLSRI
jgi:tRNA(Ser,Leu) C12 N-acetylase TAN1